MTTSLGVYRVAGGGLPASASSAAPEQVLARTGAWDVAFVDTDSDGVSDTMYLAVSGPAGLNKYVLSGGTWVARGSIPGNFYGAITARAVAGAVEIYSTEPAGTSV